MSVTGHRAQMVSKVTRGPLKSSIRSCLRSGTVADDSKSSADCSASHGVITDNKISNAVVACESQTMPFEPFWMSCSYH